MLEQEAESRSITSVLYLKDEVSVATAGEVDSVIKLWDTRHLKGPVTQACPNIESSTECNYSSRELLLRGSHAVAMVRSSDKKSPREAVEFILQLLKCCIFAEMVERIIIFRGTIDTDKMTSIISVLGLPDEKARQGVTSALHRLYERDEEMPKISSHDARTVAGEADAFIRRNLT
ncbi:hypothetical protein CASFOL_026370 [Castilleja foliolosa]|uniref:Uncharacterized protein n=1 Tax=Castilleja foliolosa TaxID=1961234 RepID=A0ABD3CHQ7_9LAMI